ncbi:RDD family protein [Chryseobacterium sp.]|uniref:RDD family protein n=1 Tax=Chryseobacterium sp. TaxID=1871047 RepID=UPI0025BDBDF0|nr:RDD family protein [Chryseobacterium sp.]MBV8327904.1 RDD family protein [Chryseobacterium sp.]
MRKYLVIVDRHKASTGIRFINYFLDRLFIQIIFYAIFFIFGIIYTLVSGKVINAEEFDNSITASVISIGVYLMVAFLYFFIMELYLGKTIAKYITGTEVISIDGNKPTAQQIANRTFSRAVPFDSLSFLGNNGWHDNWSDTRVINYKKYYADRQAKSEIDELGNKEIA